MESMKILTGCMTGLLALTCAIYVSFTLRGKGPILSNSYLFLSAKQKKLTDKKVEYKRVSIVFGCICGVFSFLTLHIFTGAAWTAVVYWALIAFVICYALYDAVKTVCKPSNRVK